MTNLKRGDYIQHRGSYAIWHVLAINPDGSLHVEFYTGKRNSPWRLKLIKRPEDYRKVTDENDLSQIEAQ